ncbi:4-hydroxyphenylpyruvate dioxygenase [Micromonospora echinospora]|uniref:4-hydroxyphenylpyruvate dioxygenase n=1 Tax=Micromonospora echinospora TaxID=1877 RepID=A0A1C4ZPC6_MICEC|nr:4-hydroxyphenylpyruvate dioxygenase [Micromonospora echinospora]OZV81647.1 4-hydroxyphenylpyruvate dioxygenase [Micromonospora echinospora]SCF34805.1 4-hydroxyphenylpyruvate dioxygenase [Micromonospora echinospora]
MEIRGIDHIEMFVGDARQAAFYFGTAVGFHLCGQGGPETGLTGQRSLLLRQADVRMVLTSGLTAEHPAATYVQRHGDGIAVVALEVDDAAGSYAELLARGATGVSAPRTFTGADATVVVAEVGGFGDVRHRLVQRDGDRSEFLPGAVEMLPVPAGVDGGPLTDIDHLAICVPPGQLDDTIRRYRDVFGFAEIFEEYIEVAGQGMHSRVVQSPSGQVTLVIIEPDVTRRPGQIDTFLTQHAGAGVQHLGLRTDDIIAAVEELSARGVRFAGTPGSYYDALEERVGRLQAPIDRLRDLGVLVDRDHAGQLMQIFTESMHVRRTLFLELIERRGALTFGSGNIKALYEAKERELAATAAAPQEVGA